MKKLIPAIVGSLVLVLMIMWAAGLFNPSPPPPLSPVIETASPTSFVSAKKEKLPVWYEAVGTVQSRTRTAVAAQVTGRVLAVKAEAGQRVTKGEELVLLDDAEFVARLSQARAALAAAEARRVQSEANYERVKKYLAEKAATPEQMESAERDYSSAVAEVARLQQVVKEAEIALGHTRISAPLEGVVAQRMVEPGDLAWPGRTLLVLHDPVRLRLEASVHESLIQLVKKGESVAVVVEAANKELAGQVEELIPSADPATRTFLVRVSLPEAEGVYPGMFGRLRLKLGEKDAVLLPSIAITKVGQLETVFVRENERWVRRYVKTGLVHGDEVEVLSGLEGGEIVAVKDLAFGR